MKELEELNTFEKTVLIACCKANGYSLSSHVPLGYIRKKIAKNHQKYFKKAFKTLVSSGFVIQHPASRNVTYALSPDGLKAGYVLKKKFETN